MKTDPNDPANTFEGGQNNGMQPFHGLTKREYFAAKAMQAQMIAYGSGGEYQRAMDRESEKAGMPTDELLCAAAVILADDLINELNKTESRP